MIQLAVRLQPLWSLSALASLLAERDLSPRIATLSISYVDCRGIQRGALGVGVLVFGTPVPKQGGYRLANVLLEIDSDFVLRQDIDESGWYGPGSLDIGFLQARAIEAPWLVLHGDPGLLRQGLDVAISGFPLGENAMVFGDGQQPKLRQISPLLRRGVVSSVIPAPVSHPHGFTIDIMTQGGQSGSPVFLCDEPSVVGIVSSGFDYTNWPLCEAGRFIVDHLHRFHAANNAAHALFPSTRRSAKASPQWTTPGRCLGSADSAENELTPVVTLMFAPAAFRLLQMPALPRLPR